MQFAFCFCFAFPWAPCNIYRCCYWLLGMFRFLSYETQSESFNCWATGLSYSMDECTRPCEIYILIPHRQFSCLSRFFFLQLNSLVISHFRKQIMSPFLAINAVGDYDVRSEVLGGGHSGEKFRPLVSLHFDFSLWLVYKTRAIDFLDQSNVRRRLIATWSLACLARQAVCCCCRFVFLCVIHPYSDLPLR